MIEINDVSPDFRDRLTKAIRALRDQRDNLEARVADLEFLLTADGKDGPRER